MRYWHMPTKPPLGQRSLLGLLERIRDNEPAPLGIVGKATRACAYALQAGLIEARVGPMQTEFGTMSLTRYYLTAKGRQFLDSVSA